jgi:large repetitive protein
LANDTDANGDTLAVTAVTQPANGTVTFTATGVSYTPNANFNGTNSFTYTISDGQGGTDTATVAVTVTGVNDAPDAVNDSATVNQGSSNNAINVLANDTDIDGNVLSVTAATNGANGAVAFTATGVSYTPNASFSGSDSFTYTISDGNGGTDTATVSVTVTPVVTGAGQLLLNEVEIDPPSAISNACQYAEIKGANAGGTVPANTYFLSVNSDGGNFGFANQAVNFGGQVVGANGTITLFNTGSLACPARTYGAGTTFFSYFSPLAIGVGSETYLVVSSTTNLISGQDLDTDDDGVFDANLGITILDGAALIVNPEEEYVYGAEVGVVNISNTISLDQPDAITRSSFNSVAFDPNAFFFGELAASPDSTTTYAAPLSPNFPVGGVLTPGAPNVP